MKIKILHLLPGRVRLKVPGLKKNRNLAGAMSALILEIPGVSWVRANPLTGNLLVYYNPVQINHSLIAGKAEYIRKREPDFFQIKNKTRIPEAVTAWYKKEYDEALIHFSSNNFSGLSIRERNLRLNKYGPNSLFVEQKLSTYKLLKEPLKDFTVQMLLSTSLISILLGQYTEALTIFVILGVEIALSFSQDRKAQKSLASLRKMGAPKAKVLIEGKIVEVPAETLVPGDIIAIEEGDTVPADSRLIEIINLEADEACLTGESIAVNKSTEKCPGPELSLAEQTNMVFMGTGVTRGSARAIVVATGLHTQMGRLAKMLEQTKFAQTPLQKQLGGLVRKITFASLLISGGVIVIGVWRGIPLLEMVRTGLSLAVGVIPEGLPAVVTIALASGVHRMVKKNAVVRKLSAVETLGNATVICTDKTGTLTRNEMTVTEIFSDGFTWEVEGKGYVPVGSFEFQNEIIDPVEDKRLCRVLLAAALCNNAHIDYDGETIRKLTGDPTEIALLAVAMKGGIPWPGVNDIYCRDKELAFDSTRKMMTVICRDQETKSAVYTKGAPDSVLTVCDRVYENNTIVPLDQSAKNEILAAYEAMANKALRVLAIAFKPLEENFTDEDLESGLIFIGLLGLQDPPRPGVAEAIAKCYGAGIKVVMITGDHPLTAQAIARKVGLLREGNMLTGTELEQMSEEEFLTKIDKIEVFSRTSPEHKLRIVKAFKKRGHIVAMTGDGVNDGPAVKEAHIGIAMGLKGTDVTREAASITLTDDNFATIVAAIEEGRIVRNNINKSIQYVLSGNFGEVLAFFLAAVSGLPLPLMPSQILLVNFVTESVPVLALGLGSSGAGIMKKLPQSPNESLLAGGLGKKIVTRSMLTGLTTFGLFSGTMLLGGGLLKARTIALANIAVNQFVNLFQCSNPKETSEAGINKNKLLIPSVGASSGLLLTAIYLPALQGLLGLTPLGIKDWRAVLVTSVAAGKIENWFKSHL